jgi:hypothetical protein
MPLTDAQLRRMEADYLDLDTNEQKYLLVGNAIRAMPIGMASGVSWAEKAAYSMNSVAAAGYHSRDRLAMVGFEHYQDRPNPVTSLVAGFSISRDMNSPQVAQFFENLYEQTTGPLDVDPPARPLPPPPPPPPEIRVRRSEIGWSDAIGTDTIQTGDRVIRLRGDNRAVFLAAPLLQWFNNHPDNPTNPLTRDPAPPNVRELGVAVVEEDDGPPPPGGGRRRRRRTRSTRDLGSRKGRKARKATRRR